MDGRARRDSAEALVLRLRRPESTTGSPCEMLPSKMHPDPRSFVRDIEAGEIVAVSVTNLQGVYFEGPDRRLMHRLRALTPIDRVGYSIFIFRPGRRADGVGAVARTPPCLPCVPRSDTRGRIRWRSPPLWSWPWRAPCAPAASSGARSIPTSSSTCTAPGPRARPVALPRLLRAPHAVALARHGAVLRARRRGQRSRSRGGVHPGRARGHVDPGAWPSPSSRSVSPSSARGRRRAGWRRRCSA